MLSADDMRRAGVRPQDAAFAYQQCLWHRTTLGQLNFKGGVVERRAAIPALKFLLYWLGSPDDHRGMHGMTPTQVKAAEKVIEVLAEKMRTATTSSTALHLTAADATMLNGCLGNWRGPGHGGEPIPS